MKPSIPSELVENEIDFNPKEPTVSEAYKRRVLTGMRPSGLLHIGHYVGALRNWLKMQEKYDCTFLVADLHAFADHADRPAFVRDSVIQVATDWLAAGIDPKKAKLVVQTSVPELENITVLLETLVPLSVHQSNPTLKTELAAMSDSSKTVSFHNYPVSQAADILGNMGDLVPAGDDQRPMVELTRRIARTLNRRNFEKEEFKLPQPQIHTGNFGRLRGTDGNSKMGKSLGNTIELNLNEKDLKKKVSRMPSPQHKAVADPGEVAGHLVFEYLDAFHSDLDELSSLKEAYQKGGVSDGHLKGLLTQDLEHILGPMRERRMELMARPDDVKDILREGSLAAQKTVQEVLDQIRHSMGFFKF